MTTNTEKEIIYFEQLIAGLLLKFKRIDNLTLKIISDEISKIKIVNLTYNDDIIKSYVEETAYGHEIKKEYLDDTGNILSYVSDIFESYVDSVVKEYLNKLNVEDLVMRKVLDLEVVTPADISFRFNEEEQVAMRNLVSKGYLVNLWDDEITNKEYMQIVLGEAGRKRAFELTFSEYVEEFKKIVAASGYDVSLVEEFLIAQDYNRGVFEILNLDSFLDYCEVNGKSPIAKGVDFLKYRNIEYKKGEGFTKEGQELFKDMLSVIDDGHCIHICHPNHLFNTKYVIGNSLEIDRINWEDIDVNKMIEIGDYKTFIMPDVKESFRYVHKRLGHQILKKIELNQDEQSYLVVLEEYILDGESNYLVRGIIKGDKNGYSMAFNPEYEKTIASNVWERSIRFSGNEVPAVYLVKRPNKCQGNK